MKKVNITKGTCTFEEVLEVAEGKARVSLDKTAIERIDRSRKVLDDMVSCDKLLYGINTGFGSLAEKRISPENIAKLQKNLVLSHSTGVGPQLCEEAVRAMMFMRACVMAQGYSGVSVDVVKRLLDMLNLRVHPVVPVFGSVGASGDLAPLAHLALPLIGKGEVIFKGEKMSAEKFYSKTALSPLTLKSKEGLALLNGTQYMTSLSIFSLKRAEYISRAADIAGALTLESLQGIPSAFDKRIHNLRPHPGQIQTAEDIRELISKSSLIFSESQKTRVQDPYSIRCLPQVHGAVKDSLQYIKTVIEIEINSVTDNPLIFPDDREIISGGNFHGQPVAIVMDMFTLALTNLGGISERRIDLLLDWNRSGLPSFLTLNPGLESGYMIAHLTAVSLLNLLKTYSHPSSSDSLPTSTGREDHVSFGSNAAWKALQSTELISQIIGIEILAALRAIDLMSFQDKLGIGTKKAYKLIREHIPFIREDHILSEKIKAIGEMVISGKLNDI